MAVLYKTAQSILANKDLSKGDTKNVIDNLVRVLTTHLQSSESVTLDGFGTFRMTMKSNGKGMKRRQGIGCTGHHDRALPALLYQESGPDHSYPLDGDRSEMYSLRNWSGRRFRWLQR